MSRSRRNVYYGNASARTVKTIFLLGRETNKSRDERIEGIVPTPSDTGTRIIFCPALADENLAGFYPLAVMPLYAKIFWLGIPPVFS